MELRLTYIPHNIHHLGGGGRICLFKGCFKDHFEMMGGSQVAYKYWRKILVFLDIFNIPKNLDQG